MDDAKEGTWLPAQTWGEWVNGVGSRFANWAFDNASIVFAIAVILLLCGIVMGIRYIYQRLPSGWVRKTYNIWWRNPMSKVTGPIRRFHRRWSEQGRAKKMAKWREGHLADIVQHAINEAEGFSRQEKRRFTLKLVEALKSEVDLTDLLPRRNNPKAVADRVKKNCEKMSKELALLPKSRTIPGGKPGEDTYPTYKDLGTDFLARIKARLTPGQVEKVETPATPQRVVL